MRTSSLSLLALAIGVAVAAPAGAEEAPPPCCESLVRNPSLGCAFERAGLHATAWADALATTTPGASSDVRAGRVFDDEARGVRLLQAYAAVERTYAEGCCFDVGGKVAVLWGTDARLLHARGLLDDQASDEYQFDLLEAWASVRLPLGRGLSVKAGKSTKEKPS